MVDICFGNTLIRRILKLQRECDYNNGQEIPFHFNYGILKGDPIDTQARIYAEALRCYYPDTDEVEQVYCDTKKRYDNTIEWLNSVLRDKKTIRLWISNTANDICNLCWLCHYTQKYDPVILLVKCPVCEKDGQSNTPDLRKSWEQVSSDDTFLSAIDSAAAMTKNDILFYAMQWKRLVKENMPLRVLIDNSIISTTDDFFDPIILKHIGSTPVVLREVLGEVLTEDWGMSVDFVLSRLEKYISQGVVLVCQESADGFGEHRIICKA